MADQDIRKVSAVFIAVVMRPAECSGTIFIGEAKIEKVFGRNPERFGALAGGGALFPKNGGRSPRD